MRRDLFNSAQWFHYDTVRYGRGDMRGYAEEICLYSKILKENISCAVNLGQRLELLALLQVDVQYAIST